MEVPFDRGQAPEGAIEPYMGRSMFRHTCLTLANRITKFRANILD